MKCWVGVDEGDRRLAADVAIANQIPEQARLVGGVRLLVAESEVLTWTGDEVANAEFARLEPTPVTHDPVVGGHSKLGAVTQAERDYLGLALIKPLHDRSNVQSTRLVSRNNGVTRTGNDVLDPMGCAGRRVENESSDSDALVLHDLDAGPVADKFSTVLQ